MALSKPRYNSKSDFDVEKRLRKGGFGAAYLVKPKRNAVTEYVLKEVNLTALDDEWQSKNVSSNQRRRLLDKCRNEHLRIQEVHHPNVVQVFGAFEEKIDGDNCYFMLMEFCEGGDLDRYLQQQADPVPEVLIQQWAKQLVGAVCHLHDHGLVHRDINPKNIFLTANWTKAKLGDFGLVKDLKTQQVQQGSFTSAMTYAYASPEQLEGKEADKPCDVWALGITFYEIAHFRRPFDGISQAILCVNILNKPAANFDESRGYSTEFRNFTMSILVKDPAARFDIVKLSKDRFIAAKAVELLQPQQTPRQRPPSSSPSSSSSTPSPPRVNLPPAVSSAAVDVGLIAQSPLLGEPMRSEICRILQENYINAADLLKCSDGEIEELVQRKLGLKWALVKWRDAANEKRPLLEGHWAGESDPDLQHWDRLFATLCNAEGKISGPAAKQELIKSRLSTVILFRIWKLADIDEDGSLDREEWRLANYLIKLKLGGVDLPEKLPAHWIPPSKQK